MRRATVIVIAALILTGGAAYYGVTQFVAIATGSADRYDGYPPFKDDFFAALRKGDMQAIKALCEPAVADHVAARLEEKGLVKTSNVWVRTGGWPAPGARHGTAYFGLEAKDGSGKAVPFRIDLDSSRAGRDWVWRITGITFDVKF
jgi:hypothetical protein